MPSRSDAIAALLAIQSKPVVKVESAPTTPATSGYCGSLGDEVISRVRDRVRARENQPVAAKPETQYEQEVRLYGREWAVAYRAQREATTRDERIKAEQARVAAAHRLDDIRMAETKREVEERNNTVVLNNLIASELRSLLADEPADVIQEVIKRAKGSKLPFVWKAYLDEIHAERAGKK